tara:strand:- start:175 stop:438 length:264 start_codon:yes stop_codon:yes gene_type:complete
MRTIHKTVLKLEDSQLVSLPKEAKILKVGEQYSKICIWYETDTNIEEKEDKTIIVVGTGHSIPQNAKKYLGTVFLNRGQFVFHVYEA